jgi:hypothetical protein
MTAWFNDISTAGALAASDLVDRLAEVEPDLSVEMLQARRTGERDRFGPRDWFGGGEPPPWRHTAHAFGFIPSGGTSDEQFTPIIAVGNIAPDERLKSSPIRVTLDGLRVAGYPGRGDHRVLFDFYAQHQTDAGPEHAHFNSTYRVREGERAAVLNFPVFLCLRASTSGLVLRCFTVNVKNDDDEQRLAFLESDVFRAGLTLAQAAQPALVPLSNLAVGFTKMIATRNRNIPVQDIYLGLDFGGPRTGARLAVGSYVAVQVPETFRRTWDWSEWAYETASGQIVNSRRELIPYNYIILGISEDGTP